MWDLLQWLHLKSDLKLSLNQELLSLIVSNVVLVGYIVGYYFSRKGAFICVFIFSEFLGVSSILDNLETITYYMVFTLLYCALYWHKEKEGIKSLVAIALVMALSIGMATDAKYYPETETAFYQAYELLFVVVHYYLIYTFIDRRLLRRTISNVISAIRYNVVTNYNTSFIWYTIKNSY